MKTGYSNYCFWSKVKVIGIQICWGVNVCFYNAMKDIAGFPNNGGEKKSGIGPLTAALTPLCLLTKLFTGTNPKAVLIPQLKMLHSTEFATDLGQFRRSMKSDSVVNVADIAHLIF